MWTVSFVSANGNVSWKRATSQRGHVWRSFRRIQADSSPLVGLRLFGLENWWLFRQRTRKNFVLKMTEIFPHFFGPVFFVFSLQTDCHIYFRDIAPVIATRLKAPDHFSARLVEKIAQHGYVRKFLGWRSKNVLEDPGKTRDQWVSLTNHDLCQITLWIFQSSILLKKIQFSVSVLEDENHSLVGSTAKFALEGISITGFGGHRRRFRRTLLSGVFCFFANNSK